ncbi:MAG TPA: GNAT family N-acetyltransferase [Thermomicrobiales bacterium]|jgi:ribosomal-protein-alanine N-acetyltransferase
MIFETARLLVRPWAADEAEAVFAIYRDPEVTRYLGNSRTHLTLDDSREWLARIAARNAAATGGLGMWAAVAKATGVPSGSIGLGPLDGGPEIEVGYHLGRETWGRGYATELAHGALEYGFVTLGLARIVGVTFPENVASQRVLVKAGLRHQGRGQYYGYGLEYFALDAAEYASRQD